MPLPLTVASPTPDFYAEAARLQQQRISRVIPVPDVDEQPFLLLAVELSFDLHSHTRQTQPGTVATDDEVGQMRGSRPDWSLFLVHNSLRSGVELMLRRRVSIGACAPPYTVLHKAAVSFPVE